MAQTLPKQDSIVSYHSRLAFQFILFQKKNPHFFGISLNSGIVALLLSHDFIISLKVVIPLASNMLHVGKDYKLIYTCIW